MNITHCASEEPRPQKKQKTERPAQQTLNELNAINEETGQNALHMAINTNDTKRVQELLDMGVNPNAKAGDGDAPLHLAIEEETDPEILKILLRAGSEVDTKDKLGLTPLARAATALNEPAMEILLDAGANPNEIDNDRATPFTLFMSHWADLDNFYLLQKFFAHKGHPLLADKKGMSAWGFALNNANPETILFFMQQFPIFPPRSGGQQTFTMQEAKKMINAGIEEIEDELATDETDQSMKERIETILDILKHPRKYLEQETEVGNSLKKMLLPGAEPVYQILRKREIGANSALRKPESSSSYADATSSKPDESKKD
jgi:hypothetical protein